MNQTLVSLHSVFVSSQCCIDDVLISWRPRRVSARELTQTSYIRFIGLARRTLEHRTQRSTQRPQKNHLWICLLLRRILFIRLFVGERELTTGSRTQLGGPQEECFPGRDPKGVRVFPISSKLERLSMRKSRRGARASSKTQTD